MKFRTPGSISTDTNDPATILARLIPYGEQCDPVATEQAVREMDKEIAAAGKDEDKVREIRANYVHYFTDKIQAFCADDLVVGYHPDDGADFGIWPQEAWG